MKNVFLFDGDNTLWNSPKGDYISKGESDFKVEGQSLIRESDGAVFTLFPDTKNVLKELIDKKITIGLVSDNRFEIVKKALEKWGIWELFDKSAINIKMWVGPCPKQIMVGEILQDMKIRGSQMNEVYWVDDADYEGIAIKINVNFLRKTDEVTLGDLLNKYK